MLVAASIRRESELPGFESISDFASESYNLAIASIQASVEAHPALASRVAIKRADFPVTWDDKEVGPAQADWIVRAEPDVLGLSCYCWSIDTLLRLARRVREQIPDTFVVLGGPSAGPDAPAILRDHPEVDAVVRGEGENAFASLLRARLDGTPLSQVAGLFFRGLDGIVENDLAPHPVDLDTLPSPYRRGVMLPTGRSLLLETSRGCRFRCRFCSWMGGARRLRYVPIQTVEADLRWAVAQGIRSVKLADTAINFDTDRLSALAGALREADPAGSMRLTYFLKPELLTQEQIEVLATIPSDEIIVGIESLTPAARKAAGKPPFDPEAFAQQMRWLRRVGPVTVSLILGLPGDTVKGLDATLDWVIRFDRQHPGAIHVICLFWLAVLPGAAMHQRRAELGLRTTLRETPYLLESGDHSPDDLLSMARRSIDRHYAHPKLRVEYFHKEYLMQDAPVGDRKVEIARVQGDTREVLVLAGENEPQEERAFLRRPVFLGLCWLKAYLETHVKIRDRYRIELVRIGDGADPNAELDAIASLQPSTVLLSPRTHPSERRAAWLDRLALAANSSLWLHGAEDPATAQQWLRLVDRASLATVGEAERSVLALLCGDPAPPGIVIRKGTGVRATGSPALVVDLDDIPSPFQWGFVQRASPTVVMQWGRQGPPHRVFGSERVYADMRWAIEQRHDHVRWADPTLPSDPKAIRIFVDALLRADPDGRIRHSYRLDPGCSTEVVHSLAPLPARLIGFDGTDEDVRSEVEALGRAWNARIARRTIGVGELVDLLWALKRSQGLPGWKVLDVRQDEEQARTRLRWRNASPVAVALRAPGPTTGNVEASFHVEGPDRPPERVLQQLRRAMTHLIQRRSRGIASSG